MNTKWPEVSDHGMNTELTGFGDGLEVQGERMETSEESQVSALSSWGPFSVMGNEQRRGARLWSGTSLRC